MDENNGSRESSFVTGCGNSARTGRWGQGRYTRTAGVTGRYIQPSRLKAARVALGAALVLLTALAAAQGADTPRYPGSKSDWELEQESRNWKEDAVVLPPYYREEDLVPFEVADARQFRFLVDRRSISVVGERVVRYTLVARSRAGVENVFFEGIRCDARTTRAYAIGQPGRAWKRQESDWRATESAWTRVLRREYFCPRHNAIRNAAEGVDALRRGGRSTATAPP